MKQRQTGRVKGANYEILSPEGGLIWQKPLAKAKKNTKLVAAIERNGWHGLPEV